MLGSLANAWKIPELRRKLLFTFAMLAAYRLGAYIPLPGVDPSVLGGGLQTNNPITGLFGTFTGGAFNNFAVFSLGIMPYITAAIVMQLMTVAIPRLQELAKEGETGQQKITQYTRYFTLALALIQSVAMVLFFRSAQGGGALAGTTPIQILVAIVHPHDGRDAHDVVRRAHKPAGPRQRHLAHHHGLDPLAGAAGPAGARGRTATCLRWLSSGFWPS